MTLSSGDLSISSQVWFFFNVLNFDSIVDLQFWSCIAVFGERVINFLLADADNAYRGFGFIIPFDALVAGRFPVCVSCSLPRFFSDRLCSAGTCTRSSGIVTGSEIVWPYSSSSVELDEFNYDSIPGFEWFG